jgi:hypothetical protein
MNKALPFFCNIISTCFQKTNLRKYDEYILQKMQITSFFLYRVRTIKLKLFCPVLGYVKSFFICKP